jgi:phospholipid/cholesterol/gamma-HCH transport system substrate-binding protein
MPSIRERKEVLVGGFLTLAAAMFVLLLFLMGSLDGLFTEIVTVEADFGNIHGLQVGDPVHVLGRKSGKVTSIQFLPLEPAKPAVIRVSMQMPAKYYAYLRDDSVVKVDKSLTGNISALIEAGSGAPLPAGNRLTGTPVADFSTITQKVDAVLEEGKKVLSSLAAVVSKIEQEGKLVSGIADLSGVAATLKAKIVPLTEDIEKTLALVQDLILDNRLDFQHTVANLRESTKYAKDLLEGLKSAPDDLQRSLGTLERAGVQVTSLLEDNRVNVDTILEDLASAATSASNLTAEIKRRPWRLLYRPSESELESAELYDTAWAYNLGATELNRSIRNLAAQIERDPEGKRNPKEIEEARQAVASSLRRYKDAEDLFWTKLRQETE